MKNRSHTDYIMDMIESIDKILRYIETVENQSEFLENGMVIDAKLAERIQHSM